MNIYFLLCWITFYKLRGTISIKIDIVMKESAFIKFSHQKSMYEILYKQPLEHKLNVSASFAKILTTKELERPRYHSNVYTDKQSLSVQSDLSSNTFIINSICKFDHDKLTTYGLEGACCEITLKNAANLQSVLDRKFCKLEITHMASACFTKFEIAKRTFDFQKFDEFELELNSRVFDPQHANCSSLAGSSENLAMGTPTRLLVTQGLQVRWELTNNSPEFGELDIGVPVDSIDINSRTIFPLRIRALNAFSKIELVCSTGAGLAISTISFESTKFDVSKFERASGKFILVHKDGGDVGGDPSGELLANLQIIVHSTQPQLMNWIKCRIERTFSIKSNTNTTRETEGITKPVYVKVNIAHLIIIPILQKISLFSILNPVLGPIELGEHNFKMFNVYDTRYGSFIDITSTTDCKAMSNSSLKCPSNKHEEQKTVLKNTDWNIIFTIQNWQKMFRIPVEFWQAEDWRLVNSDKILNKIANWNYPSK